MFSGVGTNEIMKTELHRNSYESTILEYLKHVHRVSVAPQSRELLTNSAANSQYYMS